MRRELTTVYCLITVLFSCTTQTSQSSPETTLYVYRLDPPAFVEFSAELQSVGEIPFSLSPHCGLLNVFSPPVGGFLAIELGCPNGQTVLFLDTDTSAVTQPIRDSDSHFLAWTFDGKAVYLKADSLGTPRVVRAFTDGRQEAIPVTEFTYDLATSSHAGQFTFTFSRGLGQGSELWLAKRDGKIVELLYSEPFHYISFARFSPDGSRIAFIKTPDTQTPFTVGELWVMDADGSDPRKLAAADAGHGYAANWSPEGKRLAFVVRENAEEERADQSSEALVSNVYIVDVESGALTQVTHLEEGWVETPLWSPDGNTLAFNVVIDDRMEVRIADVGRVAAPDATYRDPTGESRSLITESACCPAWMRK